jgi:hypothetical protein
MRAIYSAAIRAESTNLQRAAFCMAVLQHGQPSVFLTNDSAPVLAAGRQGSFYFYDNHHERKRLDRGILLLD